MDVRLDKWLQVARMWKTRSQANRACSLGRVKVNGQVAKPHKSLAVGDTIEFEKADWPRILVVQELRDKPVPKAQAAELYEDLSGPRPEPTQLERLMRRSPETRERGAGRPTKRDRRKIEEFKGGD
jgi:ribosome-associated heat shock protein Hsp15